MFIAGNGDSRFAARHRCWRALLFSRAALSRGMYLSYTGIRVRNLERSIGQYSGFFGLQAIRRGNNAPYGGVRTYSCGTLSPAKGLN